MPARDAPTLPALTLWLTGGGMPRHPHRLVGTAGSVFAGWSLTRQLHQHWLLGARSAPYPNHSLALSCALLLSPVIGYLSISLHGNVLFVRLSVFHTGVNEAVVSGRVGGGGGVFALVYSVLGVLCGVQPTCFHAASSSPSRFSPTPVSNSP